MVRTDITLNIPLPIPAFIAQAQSVAQQNLNEQILVAGSGANLATSSSPATVTPMPAASASMLFHRRQQVPQLPATSRRATQTALAQPRPATGQSSLKPRSSYQYHLASLLVCFRFLANSRPTLVGGKRLLSRTSMSNSLSLPRARKSGDVSVSSDGYASAGGIGINAVSSASAGSSVENGVTQSNSNTLSASTQGDLGLIDQSQEAEQANVNLQLLASIAEANSGNVVVESKGDTDAGGNGIVAVSSAAAGADLNSSVTQSNTNSASATTAGDLTAIAQTQEVEQENAEPARRRCYCGRELRLGDCGSARLVSSGGDGITAVSSATAGANLNQSAVQSNTNTASATLTAPSSGAAIQIQLAEQVNVNVPGWSIDRCGHLRLRGGPEHRGSVAGQRHHGDVFCGCWRQPFAVGYSEQLEHR